MLSSESFVYSISFSDDITYPIFIQLISNNKLRTSVNKNNINYLFDIDVKDEIYHDELFIKALDVFEFNTNLQFRTLEIKKLENEEEKTYFSLKGYDAFIKVLFHACKYLTDNTIILMIQEEYKNYIIKFDNSVKDLSIFNNITHLIYDYSYKVSSKNFVHFDCDAKKYYYFKTNKLINNASHTQNFILAFSNVNFNIMYCQIVNNICRICSYKNRYNYIYDIICSFENINENDTKILEILKKPKMLIFYPTALSLLTFIHKYIDSVEIEFIEAFCQIFDMNTNIKIENITVENLNYTPNNYSFVMNVDNADE